MLLVAVLAPVISVSIVQLGARVFADAIRHHGDCLQASGPGVEASVSLQRGGAEGRPVDSQCSILIWPGQGSGELPPDPKAHRMNTGLLQAARRDIEVAC